jgi:hypothetical protein
MRKLLLVLLMIFPSLTTLFAQEEQQQMVVDNDAARAFNGRVVSVINSSEIPSEIYFAIKNGEYKRWEIEEAYRIYNRVENSDGQASYIIIINRKEEKLALYYNSNGKLIRQEKVELEESI